MSSMKSSLWHYISSLLIQQIIDLYENVKLYKQEFIIAAQRTFKLHITMSITAVLRTISFSFCVSDKQFYDIINLKLCTKDLSISQWIVISINLNNLQIVTPLWNNFFHLVRWKNIKNELAMLKYKAVQSI